MPRVKLASVAIALLPFAALACSSAPDAPASTEQVESTGDALTATDAVARAEEWVAAKLHYCQAPYGGRDYDSACSTYCNRESNPAWNPYRSDCSGLVSWSWGLPAPGRVTGEFAPFQTDITHAIQASDLRAGDAVNNSEHVMLFKAWVTPGKSATFIEEPGCSVSQPYAREWTSNVTISGTSIHVDYNGMDFTAIRYNSLLPPNTAPKGTLDGAACAALTGWAQDPDAPTTAIKVKLDFDAADGKSGGSGSLSLTANVNRSDLCKPLGSCDHGFSAPVPAKLQDGKPHTVYAYAIDSTSGALTLLTDAPKTFTCAPPPPPALDAGAPDPGSSHEAPGAGAGTGAGAGEGTGAGAGAGAGADGSSGGCAVAGANGGDASALVLVGIALAIAARRRKDCAR